MAGLGRASVGKPGSADASPSQILKNIIPTKYFSTRFFPPKCLATNMLFPQKSSPHTMRGLALLSPVQESTRQQANSAHSMLKKCAACVDSTSGWRAIPRGPTWSWLLDAATAAGCITLWARAPLVAPSRKPTLLQTQPCGATTVLLCAVIAPHQSLNRVARRADQQRNLAARGQLGLAAFTCGLDVQAVSNPLSAPHPMTGDAQRLQLLAGADLEVLVTIWACSSPS